MSNTVLQRDGVLQALARRNLSQAKFARQLACSPGYLSDLLQGRYQPSAELRERMLAVLNNAESFGTLSQVSWDELFVTVGDAAVEKEVSPMSATITIFDTTLRDGEQSPGASMNIEREAGSGAAVGAAGRGRHRGGVPDLLGARLRGGADHRARSERADYRRSLPREREGHPPGGGGDRPCRAPAHPYLHRHLGHPHGVQTAQDARRSAGDGGGRGRSWRNRSATTWSSPPRTPPARTWTSSARCWRRLSTPARPR